MTLVALRKQLATLRARRAVEPRPWMVALLDRMIANTTRAIGRRMRQASRAGAVRELGTGKMERRNWCWACGGAGHNRRTCAA